MEAIQPPVKLKMLKVLQKLQPKILFFTFGASLIPVIFLSVVTWKLVNQPLTELEKTRLDDQVLAFRGYTSATEKGLENLASSYGIWTDLFNAVEKQDRAWLKKEVSDQLLVSTDVDAVKVVNLKREVLGESGDALHVPTIAARVNALLASGNLTTELIDMGNLRTKTSLHRQMLILSTARIYRSDRTGNSPGTLVMGQLMDEAWLRKFLNFSQPTTKIEVISLDGKSIVSSDSQPSVDPWENQNLLQKVLPAIQKGDSIYRIEPKSGFDTIYAPIISQNKLIAIAKIQIVSKYLQQASVTINRLLWSALGLATLFSVVIAYLLGKQISEPITQLAERSKTLAAGDLTTPIPGINTGGEIGQLANAYQEMALALRTLINNLEQRVTKRTQELNYQRQTLEERVYKRTQELWSKNYQLQQAHDKLQQINNQSLVKAEQLGEALSNLKKAQVQLVHTEKMSSLGQLVAGIAHEFNNPINFIYGNLDYVSDYTQELLNLIQIYKQRYPDPEIQKLTEAAELDFLTTDLPKVISSMKAGAERVCQIVLCLQNFARSHEVGMKRVNIHEGIESSLLILKHRLYSSAGVREQGDNTSDIQVIKQYGDLPLVECSPAQLNQVFMHILSNAIDALQPFKEQANKQILIQTEITELEQVIIKFKDSGSGIASEILSKVFDPFFTTKPVGKGIGLGLTISYQILQNHQGHIEIISEPGQGTEVVIELPQKVKQLEIDD